MSEFNKQTRGEFVGVGIQITQELGKPVRVESPLEDSPAYRAGVKPGDFILKVEGKPTDEMTITEAVKHITGEPGSSVVLTMKDGVTEEVRDLELVRERINIRTVRGDTRDDSKPTGWDYMIDDDLKIGYIRVSGFMDKTVPDLEKALSQLDKEQCRGLILDLRFNPGGLLNAARDMCDLFLPEDSAIVRTKGRDRGQNMVLRSAGRNKRHHRVPMIILVNEYSARASEIVAGTGGTEGSLRHRHALLRQGQRSEPHTDSRCPGLPQAHHRLLLCSRCRFARRRSVVLPPQEGRFENLGR
ncbi:MAG: PDZ domain-containing protein [Planctomycetes bacterium]|nr:PDZ domain-containing protein [Planctomycetota bacterium]